jgi:hypothetical protein
MREVFGVRSGGSGHNSDRNTHSGAPEVDMKKSTIPGYLELPPEKLERLICHEPIEKFYEVEEQPFAR